MMKFFAHVRERLLVKQVLPQIRYVKMPMLINKSPLVEMSCHMTTIVGQGIATEEPYQTPVEAPCFHKHKLNQGV